MMDYDPFIEVGGFCDLNDDVDLCGSSVESDTSIPDAIAAIDSPMERSSGG